MFKSSGFKRFIGSALILLITLLKSFPQLSSVVQILSLIASAFSTVAVGHALIAKTLSISFSGSIANFLQATKIILSVFPGTQALAPLVDALAEILAGFHIGTNLAK
jgi:tetrahydromethanopterin S-methyltransferase subunit B